MKWVSVGKTGKQSGEYRVGKFGADEGALCTLYRIWFRDDLLKTCNSFDECKEVAEEHARKK